MSHTKKLLFFFLFIFAFLSGRFVTSVLAQVEENWVNVGGCVANQCGSSEGLQTQQRTTTTQVCDTDCPIVTFTTSHQVCPTNDNAYTSTDDRKPCHRTFGTGNSRYTRYADKITETFTKTFKYDKSEDSNHCHKPTPDSLNIPQWARDDYGNLANELGTIQVNCHEVTNVETRTIVCDNAPITSCEPTGSPSPSPEIPTPTPQVLGTSTTSNGPPGPPQCTAQKPPKPGTLTAEKTSPTTVKLTWSAVTPVTYYAISYGTDPNNFQFGVPNVGNSTSFVVGALNPNLKYYFKIIAVNDCMPSDPTAEVSPGGVLGASTEKVLGASTDRLAATDSNLYLPRIMAAAVFFVLSLTSGVKVFLRKNL